MMSTILVRTLMDRRYFHGIRTRAAKGLAKCASQSVDNIGLFHLEKAFQELFCAGDRQMPNPNDFSDRALYLIQCAIPRALALVRDDQGSVPVRVRQFLLDKLKFNDNSINGFSDNFYIAELLQCLSRTIAVSAQAAAMTKSDPFSIDLDDGPERNPEEERIKTETLAEIDRYRRMDEWISSYQDTFTKAAIKCLTSMVQAKVVSAGQGLFDILQYTRSGNADGVRRQALEALVELKAARTPQMLRYMLHSLADESSPAMRATLLAIVGQALGSIAIGDDKPPPKPVEITTDAESGLVLETNIEVQVTQEDIERKVSPAVALDVLKDTVRDVEVIQRAMWHAIQSPYLSLNETVDLLDVAALLFDSSTTIGSLIWVKPMPPMYKVTHLGDARVVFTKTGVRWKPSSRVPLSLVDFKRLQIAGLKYTGPLVEEAAALSRPVEQIKLKLGGKPFSPVVSDVPAKVQMPAPPVPQQGPGPVKLSLKRKQSIDSAKLVSPKLFKAPKTSPSPAPNVLTLSKPVSGNATQGASVKSGSNLMSKVTVVRSRVVKLKTRGYGSKIDAILSGKPDALKTSGKPIAKPRPPREAFMLKIAGVAANGQVVDRASIRAVVDRPISSPPAETPSSTEQGLFSNMNAMQAGWNMGGFRNFGSIDGQTGLDVPSQLLSAVSPRTFWPPGRPGSSESSLAASLPADTRPSSAPNSVEPSAAPALASSFTKAASTEAAPARLTLTTATEPAPTAVPTPQIKDESSDDEPLMQVRQGTPQAGTPQPLVQAVQAVQAVEEKPVAPKKPGLFKLKLGKRP